MHSTAFYRTRPSATRPFVPHLRNWLAGFLHRPAPQSLRGELPKGALRRIVIGPGSVVNCESGTLWITDAQGGEIILEAGESRRFNREEDLLVEALAPAFFSVNS